MILVFHILSALLGLVAVTASMVKPSKRVLACSYGLLVATIATGTALVVSAHEHLLQTCMVGLLYVGLSLGGIVFAERKLARENLTR